MLGTTAFPAAAAAAAVATPAILTPAELEFHAERYTHREWARDQNHEL